MGAAIWSSTIEGIDEFQALFFVRFFKNHGLLSVKNRPQWYTIKGGSKNYLPSLTESFKNSIRTSANIKKIVRSESYWLSLPIVTRRLRYLMMPVQMNNLFYRPLLTE